jgi:hypothetical protein
LRAKRILSMSPWVTTRPPRSRLLLLLQTSMSTLYFLLPGEPAANNEPGIPIYLSSSPLEGRSGSALPSSLIQVSRTCLSSATSKKLGWQSRLAGRSSMMTVPIIPSARDSLNLWSRTWRCAVLGHGMDRKRAEAKARRNRIFSMLRLAWRMSPAKRTLTFPRPR